MSKEGIQLAIKNIADGLLSLASAVLGDDRVGVNEKRAGTPFAIVR